MFMLAEASENDIMESIYEYRNEHDQRKECEDCGDRGGEEDGDDDNQQGEGHRWIYKLERDEPGTRGARDSKEKEGPTAAAPAAVPRSVLVPGHACGTGHAAMIPLRSSFDIVRFRGGVATVY